MGPLWGESLDDMLDPLGDLSSFKDPLILVGTFATMALTQIFIGTSGSRGNNLITLHISSLRLYVFKAAGVEQLDTPALKYNRSRDSAFLLWFK